MTTSRTLQNIRDSVRKITGNFDQTQLTDAQIDQKINDYYLFDFPEALRVLKLKTFYTFRTIPNVGQYTLPERYYSVSNPVYVGGYECSWNQDPSQFYGIWPEYRFVQTQIETGDGGATYSFTISQTPILQGSVTISANSTVQGVDTQVVRDRYSADELPATANSLMDNTTQLFAGSINYLTGAVTVTFSGLVPVGNSINVEYYPYVASRPRDVMLYTGQIDELNDSGTGYNTRQTQQIYVRAVPNDSYEVKMVAYIQPVELLTATPNQTPEWSEWYQVLTYGASCKILIEQGDHSEAERYEEYMEKSKLLAQRRILKQLSSQRIPTTYMENNSGANVAPFPVFPIY